MPELRFMISGGGTGGHIFPAIAIADALKARHPQAQFLFVGAKDRMEMERVPQAGYEIEGIWISGIQRRLSLSNLTFSFKIMSSLLKCSRLIRRFKPDVVIGTGGFASGPLLYVAASKKIPTLIQEQNSYAGITNKLLGSRVNTICVAYEKMERFFPREKIVLTGNPIRDTIRQNIVSPKQAKASLGLSNSPTLLVLGGSLGARRINQLIDENLNQLLEEGINIIWQTGKLYYNSIIEKWNDRTGARLKIMAFIKDMNQAYAATDFVISRAGAGTLSELAAIGKASLLIPSPNVAEDHQTKNALALTDKKAALLFRESGSNQEFLAQVKKLIDQKNELEIGIKKLALPNAAEHIADEVLKLVKEK